MKRRLTGRVISDKSSKTIVVVVHSMRVHPIYKKSVRRTKKYHVHDENEIAPLHSTVAFLESRPYSRMKRWVLEEVLS